MNARSQTACRGESQPLLVFQRVLFYHARNPASSIFLTNVGMGGMGCMGWRRRADPTFFALLSSKSYLHAAACHTRGFSDGLSGGTGEYIYIVGGGSYFKIFLLRIKKKQMPNFHGNLLKSMTLGVNSNSFALLLTIISLIEEFISLGPIQIERFYCVDEVCVA